MSEVRRIRADEWEALRDLRLRGLRDSPTAFGSTFEEEKQRADDQWRERARASAAGDAQALFVVAVDGALRGMARGVPDERQRELCHLYGMFVAPDVRGRGHGRALVEAVCAWARSRGSRRVVLNVTETNAEAIRLHEGCGFVRTGAVQPLPHTPALLEIEMERRL